MYFYIYFSLLYCKNFLYVITYYRGTKIKILVFSYEYNPQIYDQLIKTMDWHACELSRRSILEDQLADTDINLLIKSKTNIIY